MKEKKEKQIEIAKNLLDVLDIETISKKQVYPSLKLKSCFNHCNNIMKNNKKAFYSFYKKAFSIF